ncbi:MAG TPA: hypothetical protein VJB15_08180 [Rhodothermia bacterium]|nr:hypothetical protein [Rhodothermia bacterium]
MKALERRGRNRSTRTKYFCGVALVSGLVAFGSVPYAQESPGAGARAPQTDPVSTSNVLRFTDARRQAAEFIAYDREIALSPDQKQVMDAALSSIPAPCCSQYSIATCCCPCNLAKATWGLSKHLIAHRQATSSEVNAAATEWLRFTNPVGYTGDACFTGGCNRSFEHNGCGGMNDRQVQ